MEEIKQWLKSDQEFFAGLMLFQKYGKRASLIRVLSARGNTEKNRKTLIYELLKLAKTSLPIKKITSAKAIVIKPSVRVVKNILKGNTKQVENDAIAQLYHSKNNLFKEYVALLHQLEYLSEKERREASLNILDIWDEIEGLWDKINYAEKYGVIRADKPKVKDKTDEMNIVELLQQQRNERCSISRYKRLFATAKTSKTKAKYQDLLDKHKLILSDIDRKLSK